MRCRIVRRVTGDGKIEFVIQQKRKLFWFLSRWVDGGVSAFCGRRDSFDAYYEAKANLWAFDGSKPVDVEVSE